MIAIIDYGIGNLGSVKNALDSLRLDNIITGDPDKILKADKIILPGVGAFSDAINTFLSKGLDKVLFECINLNKPILGICVGMQMLFEYSNEYGRHKGLGILKGEIIRFNDEVNGIKYKVPHMGWNQIKVVKDNKLLKGLDNKNVYFVHSYHLSSNDTDVIATTEYAGTVYGSAVSKGNIYATQFHPEKSGDVGLQILKNFGEL